MDQAKKNNNKCCCLRIIIMSCTKYAVQSSVASLSAVILNELRSEWMDVISEYVRFQQLHSFLVKTEVVYSGVNLHRDNCS